MTAAHLLGTLLAILSGGAAGIGSGWLSVKLEGVEHLEEEETSERLLFEEEARQVVAAAEQDGLPPPDLPVWQTERYGWTWLERWLCPGLTAAAFAAFVAHADHASLILLLRLVWVTVLIHISAFDIKHRLILNRITYPAVPAALLASALTADVGLARALLGAAVIYAFFMAQSLVLGGRAVGQGDAKLGAFIGAITGLGTDYGHLDAIYAAFIGIILGGVAGVLLLVTRVRSLKEAIPYGPFLCAGAALVLYQASGAAPGG